jgi:hypothetical protein
MQGIDGGVPSGCHREGRGEKGQGLGRGIAHAQRDARQTDQKSAPPVVGPEDHRQIVPLPAAQTPGIAKQQKIGLHTP